jgi:hypothetical protein
VTDFSALQIPHETENLMGTRHLIVENIDIELQIRVLVARARGVGPVLVGDQPGGLCPNLVAVLPSLDVPDLTNQYK